MNKYPTRGPVNTQLIETMNYAAQCLDIAGRTGTGVSLGNGVVFKPGNGKRLDTIRLSNGDLVQLERPVRTNKYLIVDGDIFPLE